MAAYSASALALVTGKHSEAQVIYTDVDPDQSFEAYGDGSGGGLIYLDIDDDGGTDFRIMVKGIYDNSWELNMMVSAQFDIINDDFELNANNWARSICCIGMYAYRSWSGFIYNQDNNYNIGPAGAWNSEDNQALFYSVYGGTYEGSLGFWGDSEINNQYVGFRKKTGSDYQYGWIRLSTAHSTFDGVNPASMSYAVTVHDYAFNLTYNDPILAAEGMPCNPPVPIGTINITPTSAKVKWEPEINSDKYKLWYREEGVVAWTKKTVIPSEKKLKSLLCNTTYEWKVRTVCDGGNSAFSEIQTFTTDPCRMDDAEEIISTELSVFPNPAADQLFIEMDGWNKIESIQIVNTTGQIVKEIPYSVDQENELITVDISELPKGLFVITVVSNNSIQSTQFVHQ